MQPLGGITFICVQMHANTFISSMISGQVKNVVRQVECQGHLPCVSVIREQNDVHVCSWNTDGKHKSKSPMVKEITIKLASSTCNAMYRKNVFFGVVTCVGDRWRIGPTFVVIPVRASVFLSR